MEHKHIVKSVDFSSDRARLATAGHEGMVRIFDVEREGADSGTAGSLAPLACLVHESGTQRPAQLNKVLWVPPECGGGGGALIAAGGADGVVRVWDTRAGDGRGAVAVSLRCFEDSEASKPPSVMDLEIVASAGALGPTLTVCAGDCVRVLDATTWAPRRAPLASPVHFREEGGCSLSRDGARLLLGGGRHGGSRQGALGVEKGATRVGDVGSDLTVFALDYATGAILDERKGHCGPVRCVRAHPDGTTFATGSEDGTIRLWDAHVKPAPPRVANDTAPSTAKYAHQHASNAHTSNYPRKNRNTNNNNTGAD